MNPPFMTIRVTYGKRILCHTTRHIKEPNPVAFQHVIAYAQKGTRRNLPSTGLKGQTYY